MTCMEPDETFTVTHLVATFRQAVMALIPSAEAISIPWGEDMYDDWERIQEVLFYVLVECSVRGDLERFGSSQAFPRYDFDINDYRDKSWFEVVIPELEGQFALVRLLSSNAPFSDIQVVRVEANGLPARSRNIVPWSPDRQFRAQLRAPDGSLTPVESVTPSESVV